MTDPRLESSPERLEELRRQNQGNIVLQDYGRRSPEQMAKDLTAAHDRIRKLQTDGDLKQAAITKLERRTDLQKTWLWIEGCTNAALWALVLVLVARILR